MFEIIEKEKVVLLLSGGNDSLRCLEILQSKNYEVYGLCIDGKQGIEKIGAMKAAQHHGIRLEIVKIEGFDEETWNPVKLILRDIKMGIIALRTIKKCNSKLLATGVKKSDTSNPKLWWLSTFLIFGEIILKLFNIKIIYPVWENN